MLTKQFATNSRKGSPYNDKNSKFPESGLLSPKARQIMSPSVIGKKGMFSANKRKAVDIIREAIKREEGGDVEAALRLCEDAASVFPDQGIVANIAKLRSKLKQQQKAKVSARAQNSAKASTTHKSISSGSDIISDVLKKNTLKHPVQKPSPRSVDSPSAVMIRSMTALAHKAVAENLSLEREAEEQSFEHDVYEHHEEECASPIDPIAAEAAPVVAPAPAITREMVANTLKAKVSEAINYQLLDILNNGSSDELRGLHLIGQKRVQYIMELREEGFVFNSLDDLEMISFSPKTIRTFKELNLALAVGAF